MRPRPIFLPALALVALTLACGEPPSAPREEAVRIRYIAIQFAGVPQPPSVLVPGETYQLVAIAYDSAAHPIPGATASWTSSDTTVVRITASGVLTLLKPGVAQVLASFGTVARLISIRVEQPAATITLNLDSLPLVPTAAIQLSVTLRDANGRLLGPRPMTWTSSDSAIGLLSDPGSMFALGVGRVVIRVSREGISDSAVFRITRIRFVTFSVGGTLACGVTALADTWCWGGNSDGQLGRGSAFPQAYLSTDRVPGLVQGGHRFRLVSAGFEHACAIATDGAAWCWGRNAEGQLGDGTTLTRDTPVPVAGGFTFDTLVAGEISTCGITASGQSLCWGSNSAGQTGTNTPTSLTPAPVVGGVPFEVLTTTQRTVEYGQWHSCGLDQAGQAWCWGRNFFGQLGDSTRAALGDPNDAPWGHGTPAPVAGGHTFVAIAVGGEFTCGILSTGERACWGSNTGNALGLPQADVALTPVVANDGLSWVTLQAGLHHGCGLVTGGEVYCWGSNGSGDVGQPRPVPSSATPVPIGGYLFTRLSTGGTRSCGLNTYGLVVCWGGGAFATYFVPGQ